MSRDDAAFVHLETGTLSCKEKHHVGRLKAPSRPPEEAAALNALATLRTAATAYPPTADHSGAQSVWVLWVSWRALEPSASITNSS